MGEKIKNLRTFSILGTDINIELNEGQTNKGEFDIHIESPMLRFNMNDKEYMKMVVAVIEARKKLISNKSIEV